eukprot:GAHX01001585.1.p1 GENE.GAHX01001585.1~~GAHX01001585.1.p1  ORF type:complete len:288 (-),score=50.81 GAHX01001585.1:71-934(-)
MSLFYLFTLLASCLTYKQIKLSDPFGIAFFDHQNGQNYDTEKENEILIYLRCKDSADDCVTFSYIHGSKNTETGELGLYKLKLKDLELGITVFESDISSDLYKLGWERFKKEAKSQMEALFMGLQKDATKKLSFTQTISDKQTAKGIAHSTHDKTDFTFKSQFKLPLLDNVVLDLSINIAQREIGSTGETYYFDEIHAHFIYEIEKYKFYSYKERYCKINFLLDYLAKDGKTETETDDKTNEKKVKTYKSTAVGFGVVSLMLFVVVVGGVFYFVRNTKKYGKVKGQK